MPPPKMGPMKKRKSSKRSADFGIVGRAHKSAPVTPTESNSPIKEEEPGGDGGGGGGDSDSEFGFDSQWGMPKI